MFNNITDYMFLIIGWSFRFIQSYVVATLLR